MSRLVSVWLPAWPIDRLARTCRHAGLPLPWAGPDSRELPFALVESGVHGLTLTAVNGSAWREGLRPGQALADARAAVPALLTRPAEPDRDRSGLAALAQWAGRYGPSRNVEGVDGLWIDVSGVAHLYGGEERLLEDLIIRLSRAGLTARAGLADTPGAAFALARFATTHRDPALGRRDAQSKIVTAAAWRIARPGAAREALATLPVAALRLPADGVVLLHRLGLGRIGQLYDLPREALARRFPTTRGGRLPAGGSPRASKKAALLAGTVLARLDQALGLSREPRAALEEPPRHHVQRLFAEPLISAPGVTAALEALAHDLAGRLEARCEGGTRFALDLYRADGSAQKVRIGASRPCRDAHHLLTLLAEKLDSLDAGFGIDALSLACTAAEALTARQIALAGAGGAAGEVETAALLDRLSNRLGAARVVRLIPADSHIPERAQRRVPMLAETRLTEARLTEARLTEARLTDTASAASQRPGRAPLPARPPFLLPAPEPIAVLAEVPEGPPLRFTWRRLTRRVVRAEGPERIEPEWWRAIGRPAPRTGPSLAFHLARPRDYYRIEDERGGRYWLFRAGLYGREEIGATAAEDAADDGEARPESRPESSSDSGAEDDRAASGRTPAPAWFLHGVFG